MHLPMLQKPVTRGDCLPGGCNEARPCVWTSCAHHLAKEHRHDGRGRAVHMRAQGESCVLDVADRGGATLEEVSEAFGLWTRERVRQIEAKALKKLTAAAKRLKIDPLLAQDEPMRHDAVLDPMATRGGASVSEPDEDGDVAPEDRGGFAWQLGADGSFPPGTDKVAAERVWHIYDKRVAHRFATGKRAPTAAEIVAYLEHKTKPTGKVSLDLLETRARVLGAWRTLTAAAGGRIPTIARAAEVLGLSLPTVLDHARILDDLGLIERRKRGERASVPPPAPQPTNDDEAIEPPRQEEDTTMSTYTPLQETLLGAIRRFIKKNDRGPTTTDLLEHGEGDTDTARMRSVREALEPLKGKLVDWSRGPSGIRLLDGTADVPEQARTSARPAARKKAAAKPAPTSPEPAVRTESPLEFLRARRVRLSDELDRLDRAIALFEEAS